MLAIMSAMYKGLQFGEELNDFNNLKKAGVAMVQEADKRVR